MVYTFYYTQGVNVEVEKLDAFFFLEKSESAQKSMEKMVYLSAPTLWVEAIYLH